MKLKTTLTILLCSLVLFISCTDESNDANNADEPVLTSHYYFEGKLGDEPFTIEQKVYDGYNFVTEYSFDYGGTTIFCANQPDDEIHSECYSVYASGLLTYNTPKDIISAKMYFGPIKAEEKTLESEINGIHDFFNQNKEVKFRRDFGNTNNFQGNIAFDFFPPEGDNPNYYYSTRFNDNSEYVAKIISVNQIEDNFIIIEGTIDNCKLFDSRDDKDENQGFKMLTDFKFKVKIQADFNFNIYND
ncbi:conserved exported hypothetical protein [Tenacibaculum sp. 190524A05c]|uniref:hypothetical protein n=1 Tax=Tenacibaculum platacis TaxID=3137852 RepID=UPI0031FB068D